MTISSRTAATLLASLVLFASPALAQTPAAPAAKTEPAAPAATDKMSKSHSAESLQCSKEADEKGLKGKERRKFRRECIRAAKEKK